MKAFFESAESLKSLDAAAKLWAGTPFRHNSGVRGEGANCVMAIAGVLDDAGFKVPTFDLVPTNWSRFQTESKMEKWLDAHTAGTVTDGTPVLFVRAEMAGLLPGDLVGFKAGLCVHHLGLILPEGRFFQCNESMGAVILSRAEREFQKRLARSWRPVGL